MTFDLYAPLDIIAQLTLFMVVLAVVLFIVVYIGVKILNWWFYGELVGEETTDSDDFYEFYGDQYDYEEIPVKQVDK